ncbi:MAG: HYR domain-containing protein [candidate division Zixibacteria bacterium]
MKLGNCIAGTRCSEFKLSKSILILFATVLVAFFVSASTQAQPSCDTTNEINHYTLVFDTVIYDPPGTSQWVYNLTWDGTPPELSHFLIELCTLLTDANLIAVEPDFGSIGPDGSTGLYGVKWDDIENFPADTAITFSFTLDDSLGIDHTQFAPKAGINFNIATICGPSTDCDDQCANDNTPPIIVCPADITVGNDPGQCSAVVTYSATASDDCSAASISSSPPSGSVFLVGTTTVTCIATDDAGNADTCTFDITVNDTEAPVATCPADITVGNDPGQCSAIVTYSASITDNCAGASISCSPASGSVFPVGTTTVTCIAIDAAGNADTCTFDITVNDTEAPVATCPADITVGNDPGQCSTVVTFSGSVTDNCAGASIACSPPSGSAFPVGTTTVTCIAIDAAGNADTCTFIVTVNNTEPPVATCPAGDTLLVCDLSQICLPGFACSDADGNLATSSLSGGTLSGDTACFTPVEGDNVLTLICVDDCGAADTCVTIIHIVLNSAPAASCPPSDTVFVCDLSEICIDGFSCSDPDGNIASSTAIGGILSGTQICFTPVEGDNVIGIICTDSCGTADTCETIITVITGVPPEISVSAFDTVLTCTIGDPICIPLQINVPDSGLSGTFSLGYIDFGDSTACFSPGDTGGVYCGTIIITDSCGLADTAEVCIFVTVNGPPVIEEPTRQVVNVCAGDSVCVEYSVSDPNDNVILIELVSNPLNAVIDTLNNEVCFVAPDSGCSVIVLRATDGCDAFDEDTITVCVIEQPVATCPGNFSQFVCDLSEICVSGFSTENADTSYAIGGTLSGNTVCFTPVPGNNTIMLVAENECGADTCTTIVNVTLNSPPELACNSFVTSQVCSLNTEICISGFGASDPDNNIASCTINGQPYTPGNPFCFIPQNFGLNTLLFICTDECGNQDTCITIVDVVQVCDAGECAAITIEKTHNTPQGRYENVSISIEDMPDSGIGGFDLLIQYDPSALSLSTVEPGDFLVNCDWEYFAYRYGPSGNCGSNACPTGKVRILALAETNNGAIHPSCFYSNPAELAVMTYLVTNDITFECQYVPIRFSWYDCGDNTISSKAGDSLYISQAVYYYYDGVIWNEITDISAEFPSLNGANYTCDTDLGDGNPDPIRSLCFYNGGVSIVCSESNGDRGDINLNGVANEVADAVLFGNYFVYGLSVFTINLEGQIAATDVNADGTVLSVADLVYLIRIVIGDALPYSKVVTSVNIDFYHYSDGRLGVGEKTSIGAAYVVAEGEVTPILLATEMDMKYHFDGSNTRILVWSEAGSGFTGDFLLLDADLISFELATAEGQPVSLNTLPTAYELLQNYPNPFNPATVISFTLPSASEYSLTIYNLNGQVVKEFEGVANSAGTVDLEWQAVDVASGVYFYRLEANYGKYVETKKMILLK